ncbi:MAG: DUF4855 domain-containing protein [Chitinophagales bacterium]
MKKSNGARSLYLVSLLALSFLLMFAGSALAAVSVAERPLANGTTELVVNNGAMEVVVSPALGGRIFSIRIGGGPNLVNAKYGLASDHPGVLGNWAAWETYRSGAYRYEVVQGSGDKAVIKLTGDADAFLYTVVKTYTIPENSTTIKVEYQVTNATRRDYTNVQSAQINLLNFPQGGKAPIIYIPLKNRSEYAQGIPTPFEATREGWFQYESTDRTGDYIAVYDPNTDTTARLTVTGGPTPWKLASGVAVGDYVSMELQYFQDSWPKQQTGSFGFDLSFSKGVTEPAIAKFLASPRPKAASAAAPAEATATATAPQTPPGFYPPNTPASANLSNIMLIYSGYYEPPILGTWMMRDALPYVAYLDRSGKVQDWFFDAFLFLGLQSGRKRAFDSPARATAADKVDWQWYIDRLFADRQQIAAFDEATAYAGQELNQPDHKSKIIIAIPNPHTVLDDFGDVDGDGTTENFTANDRTVDDAVRDRVKAVKWYVDQTLAKLKEKNFQHLEIVGYYWLEEKINFNAKSEVPTIQAVAKYLHDKGLKFYWIPYFKSSGFREWKDLGFDVAIMQPNYFFTASIPVSRFKETVDLAKQYNMGIEIEGEGRMLDAAGGQWRDRYYEYLNQGIDQGYMKDAIKAYYQGAKALLDASRVSDPQIRRLYDATYEFVKGTYTGK